MDDTTILPAPERGKDFIGKGLDARVWGGNTEVCRICPKKIQRGVVIIVRTKHTLLVSTARAPQGVDHMASAAA